MQSGYKKDETVLQPLLQQFKPLRITCSNSCQEISETQVELGMMLAIGDGNHKGFGLFIENDISTANELLCASYNDYAIDSEG